MTSEEKKLCFVKKMIEAWSLLLEESVNTSEEEKCNDEIITADIETVRQLLLIKAQAGKSEEIRDVLKAFNVKKLSDLEAKYYSELIQKVQEI